MAVKVDKTSPATKAPAVTKPVRRRGSRLRALVVLTLLMVAALVGFAPNIIARTALSQQIVPTLIPDYPGEIVVGSVSLDWLSPVELREVTFRDLTGEPLARVPVVRTEKRLLDIVLDRSDAGKVFIESPHVRIAMRDGGSNLEDVLRPMIDAPGESSTSGVVIESNSGTLELIDISGRRSAKVANISLLFGKSFDPAPALQLNCSGIVEGPIKPGTFRVESYVGPAPAESDSGAPGSLKLNVVAEGIRLDDWQPIVTRLNPNARCSGALDAQVELNGDLDETGVPAKMVCSGRVVAPEILATLNRETSDKPTSIRDLAMGGRVEYRPGCLQLDDVCIKSDFARLSLNGKFDIPQQPAEGGSPAAGMTPESIVEIARNGEGRIEGAVDFAKLATLFPDVLRVREGVELTGGMLQVAVLSESKEARRNWQGMVEAKGLAAIENGRSLKWDRPLLLKVSAHDDAEGPVLDAIECQSDFMKATGKGTLKNATVNIACDLDRLSKELERFIDVESSRFAGKMKLDVICKQHDAERYEALARGAIEKFEFALPGRRLWSEERLEAELKFLSKLIGGRIDSIETASVLLKSGEDKLDVKLLNPVQISSSDAEIPLGLQFEGDLTRWRARCQHWADLEEWDLQGRSAATGRVILSANTIRWEEFVIRVEQLRAFGPGLYLSDPNVRVQSAGTWNRKTGELSIPKTTWASNALSLRADQITLSRSATNSRSIAGQVVFRGGVDQLAGWLRDPRTPSDKRMQGTVSGNIRLTRSADITDADGTVQFNDVALFTTAKNVRGGGWNEAWREKKLEIGCRARYGHDVDTLELKRFDVTSDALKLGMKGAVGRLTSRPIPNIAGNVEYDWKNLTARLEPWLGSDFQFSGEQKNQFAIRGSRQVAALPKADSAAATELAISMTTSEKPIGDSSESNSLSAEAGFGWKSAKIYGLDVGPADVKANFDGSSMHISPLDLAVGEGRIKFAPDIRLYGDSPSIVLPPGRTVENLKLSPEVCHGWLKYVAPLLADATRAEGRLSLDLTGADIPFADPGAGEAGGTVIIEQADVTPGPTAKQIIQIAEQVRQILRRGSAARQAPQPVTWLRLPPQNVEVRLTERRVHHRLIEFQLGDMIIRTEGSVGLDETLALTADIPVLDEWVQENKTLAGMKGQMIRVPIGGTLNRPQVDPSVLRNLARQIGGTAANEMLQDGVRNQFERLFKTR